MRPKRMLSRVVWSLSVTILIAASPLRSAGFGIFEHGTKAMGMGGAFTAQADDPSAMFYNVGGLAFQKKQRFAGGFTYITSGVSEFVGADPFPGDGYRAEQETLTAAPFHIYWVRPIGRIWRFGLAVNSPFGLKTEWKDKDDFLGRFINTKAALTVIDLNPNVAVELGEKFGVGFGLIARFSEVELHNRNAITNPFNGLPVEIAKTDLEGGFNNGLGWQIGILHRYTERFSWGLSYRSRVEIEYDGDALFTQVPTGNPLLDALVGTQLPFGTKVPVATEIEFPDMGSLGVMFAPADNWRLEVDANWTGWSSFTGLVVTSSAPGIGFERSEDWEDVWNYRLGVAWSLGERSELRFGLVYDESPQPEKSVSPLLPGSDRKGVNLGYGTSRGKLTYDVALGYIVFDDRTTTNSQDGFYGTYSQTGLLLGFTLGFQCAPD